MTRHRTGAVSIISPVDYEFRHDENESMEPKIATLFRGMTIAWRRLRVLAV
jgi:hypothetical protein